MSKLTGPLYNRVYQRISVAKPTGTRTQIKLLQQKICIVGNVMCPPLIYHVAIHAQEDIKHKIFEHGPVEYDRFRGFDGDTFVVDLPSVHNSLDDISAFELTLADAYIVGVRDCRHHVLDLLDYLYPSD